MVKIIDFLVFLIKWFKNDLMLDTKIKVQSLIGWLWQKVLSNTMTPLRNHFIIARILRTADGHRSIHGRNLEIFMKRMKVQSCTSSWQQSKFLSEWELLVSVGVIIVWIFYWIISVNHHFWHFITRTSCFLKLLNIHGNNFYGVFQRSWSDRGSVPRIDRVYPGYFA